MSVEHWDEVWAMSEPMSRDQVAKVLGLTRAGVKKIELRALRKLRNMDASHLPDEIVEFINEES